MDTAATRPRHIVIAGGGFAGTTLARALERRLPPGWQVLLLSEESYTTFNPMLPEVVGAAVFPEHVIAPIRDMLSRTRFIMGRVEGVDLRRRSLGIATLAGMREVPFDHLVLAFGQRASLPLVPGMAEHALPLKLVGDALHIRNRLLQRLAHMELTADAAERWALGHVVVIGGGFSGVEVAGAVADFMRSAHRRHPLVPRRELRVTLLQDQARLLPELPPALGRAAERALRERGVDVRLGARAVRVGARFVWLADDTRLASATVLCTTGERAHALVEQLGLATQRGRIVTAADGSVPGHAGLWALGDCAATPNAADGQTSLPTAQFAVAQAEQMADNLLRHVEGLDTRAFSHRNRAMMATTGHHKGVARILGVPLTGLPAWLLWRAYYLARMPTFGRKLRIWVEWTSSLFFPVDVTHLRFTRTADVDTPASPR